MDHSAPRTPSRKGDIPTVSRVAGDTLVELIYDAEKRTTGLAVSRFGGLWNIEQEVRIGTGEVLVPYSPKNNLIANECVLLPSVPVEYGLKHELIADIRAFLHRYVDLSPLFEHIAAYYVLLSWVHDGFNELPYLRLHGEYGTGKTRGLLAIGSLCYKPFFASAASTLSPIFHILDAFGGTLILDEADFRFSDATNDLVKLLNNGTVRGMPVLRSVVNQYKEFNPYAFRVFGPKIIAMRGSFEDNALESRFLTEETGTRPLRADIPIHLPSTLKPEALALRNRLLHYRLCHFFEIKTDLAALTKDIAPRLNQTALSLLSLVDEPDVRRKIQESLVAQNDAIMTDRRQTLEADVLAAVRAAFLQSDGRHASVRAITEQFNATAGGDHGMPVSNKWIGYMLRKRLHVMTHKSGGVFVVPISEMPRLDALSARFGLANDN